MCLSVPARVDNIDGHDAMVNVSGNTFKVSLDLLDDVAIGDYVLVHAGYAIQKIDEQEAIETLNLFHDLENL
jgi:hydrogenase expression/formation protein HypC